ncbi:MAG: DUF1963 domain-containing protein [Kiloniellales bacterium]|nr:DUF1963 domain-containing protein [Kiloniellales bacterium]
MIDPILAVALFVAAGSYWGLGFFGPVGLGLLYLALFVLLIQTLREAWYWVFGSRPLRGLLRLRFGLGLWDNALLRWRLRRAASRVAADYGLSFDPADPQEEERLARLIVDLRAMNRKARSWLRRPMRAEDVLRAILRITALREPSPAYLSLLGRAAPPPAPLTGVAALVAAIRAALSRLVFRRSLALVSVASAGGLFDALNLRTRGTVSQRPFASFPHQGRPRQVMAGYVSMALELGGFERDDLGSLAKLPLGDQRRLVAIRSALEDGSLRYALTLALNPSLIGLLSRLRPLKVGAARARAEADRRAAEAAARPTFHEAGDLTETEIADMIETQAQPAIFLRRCWPIGAAWGGKSWLGGRPCLPAQLPWPRDPKQGTALHFLAQIDCEDLPALDGASPLPRDGRLLFFADLDEERLWSVDGEDRCREATRVIYVPKSEATSEERDPPEDTPDVDHPFGRLTGPYADKGRKGFAKWPVSAHPIETYDIEGMPWSDRRSNPDFRREAIERHYGAIRALLPAPPAPEDRVTLLEWEPDSEAGPAGAQRQVFRAAPLGPAFPWCGLVVSEFLSRLEREAQQGLARAREELERRGAQAEDGHRAEVARYESLVADLAAFAAALGPLDPVEPASSELREKLLAWIAEMAERRHPARAGVFVGALQRAVMAASQRAVTDPEIAERLPAEAHRVNAERLTPDPRGAEHLMLGPTQFKTNPTGDRGLRLLLLSSDPGLDFMFCDVGVVEFWILEEDLAARRFERAWANTAGG